VRLNTWRYRLTRDPQEALRQRLRELAAVRVRFGYRRLTVLLRREGWKVAAFKQKRSGLGSCARGASNRRALSRTPCRT
jgi:hypothetical protein